MEKSNMSFISNKKTHSFYSKKETGVKVFFALNIISSILMSPAYADQTVAPGQTINVTPNTPVNNWQVNGGTLIVNPGGVAQTIHVNRGTLNMDGGLVDIGRTIGGPSYTLALINDATATINNSKIYNLHRDEEIGYRDIALSVASGSHVAVTGSDIAANGRGIALSGTDSTLALINTTVAGYDNHGSGEYDGGVGGTIFEGVLTAESSHISGDQNGLHMVLNENGATTKAMLSNTTVSGGNGSAIVMGTISNSYGKGDIDLAINDGSQLSAGNGTLVEAINGITANITVNNSQLAGNIIADQTSGINAALSNQASFSGNMENVNTLSVNNSVVTGDINLKETGPGQVNLSDQARVSGNINNIKALNADNTTLSGQLNATAGDNGSHASLVNDSVVQGGLNNFHTVEMNNSQLTGNVIGNASTPESSALKLLNHATLTGDIQNYASVSIADQASWTMTQSAQAHRLSMDNGTVNLNSQGSQYRALTADSLDGKGRFVLRTDIAAMKGDQVIINGHSNGEHTLAVTNSGAEPQHDNALTVVKTQGGEGKFSLQDGVVDAGTYEYKLKQAGNDWVLAKTNSITPSTRTVLSLFNAAPNIWTGELRTVRTRLGNLRTETGHNSGVWAQYMGQQTNVSPRAGLAYQQKQYGLTLGADKAFDIQQGTLLAGVFAGSSDNTISADYGRGNIDSYFLGGYATWLADSGWFADVMVKGNQFHNKASAYMSDGQRGNSAYNSNGLGISTEVGKTITLQDSWFIEPSLQLSSLWVSGKKYQVDNGMDARNSVARSQQAALNLAAGKDLVFKNGMTLTPYVKTAWQYEFAKNNRVNVNDTSFKNDMSGGTGVYGAGVNAQISKNSYIYTDMSYSKGAKSESPWSANVGVRINW